MTHQEDLMTLVERISRLERQNRHLRRALLSIAMLSLVLVTAGLFGARTSSAHSDQPARRKDSPTGTVDVKKIKANDAESELDRRIDSILQNGARPAGKAQRARHGARRPYV